MSPSSNARTFWGRIPITPKMVFITLLVGVIAWVSLDGLQTRYQKKIFNEYQAERLKDNAREARIRLESHVAKYHQAVRILIAQKNFIDYISDPAFMRHLTDVRRFRSEIPPWLPDASIMRHFVPLRYALLIDGSGKVREIYENSPEPLPASLGSPSELLRQMSHSQSFLTEIEGRPYLVSSESVDNADGLASATLMIAMPMDRDFLSASQLVETSAITALVSQNDPRVIASSQEDVISQGVALTELQKDFLVTGKSFFDWGGSELTLQLMTFVPRKELDLLARSMLNSERLNRAITGFVVLLCCAIIMYLVAMRIRGIAHELVGFTEQALGGRSAVHKKGDELVMLTRQFRELTEEVISARERLRRQAEELLREKTVYLDNILHSSRMGIIATDLELKIKYFNTLAERICDIKAGEATGRSLGDPQLKCLCSLFSLKDAISGVMEGRDTVNTCEHIQDGKDVSLEMHVSGIKGKEGDLIGILMMMMDVTERVEAERELKKYTEALKESNRELEQFAYVASHDLQEPLRKIASFTELLAKRYRGQMDADADRFINYITDGAYRMRSLINDLLLYSRISTRAQEFVQLDMGRLVDRISGDLGLMIREHSASVRRDELPEIKADPSQMGQLIQNLIGNALKFGGNDIVISARKGEGEWVFSVHDNGIGIPPEFFDRIFLMFQRLHSKDEYTGTGIGLALCKKIVERHGGRIWVESGEGQGSTFYFSIPEHAKDNSHETK